MDEERIRKCIRELRSSGACGISETELNDMRDTVTPLDDVIEMMEQANQTIGALTLTEMRSIRDHLAFMKGKSLSFEDSRFDNLFSDRNTSAEHSNEAKGAGKGRSMQQCVDYSYREKLAGFVAKTGHLEWDEDRIADFIGSIRK